MDAPTPEQLAFLSDPPPLALGRIATVDPNGMPHIVPTGWSWDATAGELVLGGHDVPRTRRARHIRATGVAAVVVDGVDTSNGWAPWALIIRGGARVDDEAGVIRVSPLKITSWGLAGIHPGHGRVGA